jgi:hypothetical protein
VSGDDDFLFSIGVALVALLRIVDPLRSAVLL